jgi:hypothetical protein
MEKADRLLVCRIDQRLQQVRKMGNGSRIKHNDNGRSDVGNTSINRSSRRHALAMQSI